jgi:transposase InsO family protein
VEPDVRDQIVDFVNHWSERAGIMQKRLIGWLGVSRSKYFDWCGRYGRVNEHNAWIPRDFWLDDWEREAIVNYWGEHPADGYRRLAFMMLDDGVVAASPATVFRVLKQAGVMRPRGDGGSSRKGKGFQQPLAAHEHWHMDVSYINLSGTFYYLCSVIDGFSRSVLHWEIREQMKERDVQTVLLRAREMHPEARPRVISDNGPQFVAREFKQFIRISGMTHVRTSPYYPQSNGKQERWHKSLKAECIRPMCPLDLEDARRMVGEYVGHYNTRRLHSAIGYVTPADMLAGRAAEIHAERDRGLEEARRQRAENRQRQKAVA